MVVEYEMFRCPCGSAGLYTAEKGGHIIEAFCPPIDCPATDENEQCPNAGTCKYCELLKTLPEGFLWEAVCGWEEADKKKFREDTTDDLLASVLAGLDDMLEKEGFVNVGK